VPTQLIGGPPRPLYPEFLVDFGQRFKDAWNRLDGEAVAALCTEDVVWNDPAIPHPARGRREVAEFVNAMGHAFPDLHVEPLDGSPYAISPELSRVYVPYLLTATWREDFEPLGLAPTNRRMETEGVEEWTFRGDLICHYRTYYDSLDLARQLGPLPRVDALGQRILRRGQRLQAAYLRRSSAASSRARSIPR
jgi:steroid delta-isomerase-like uncharacterized protein